MRIVGELLAHGTGPVLLTRAIAGAGRRRCWPRTPAASPARRPSCGGRAEAATDGRVLVVSAGTADRRSPTSVRSRCARTGYAPTAADRRRRRRPPPAPRPPRRRSSTPTRWSSSPGMEGALASVVGGSRERPSIAVPTSVGYGAAFEGVTALLAMLVVLRERRHRRRHRQRLRRGVRGRAADAISESRT